MSSIRQVALREPLVDVVEPHQLVTDSCVIKVHTAITEQNILFINPWHACAVRVTVVVPFVCLFVVFCHHAHVQYASIFFLPYRRV